MIWRTFCTERIALKGLYGILCQHYYWDGMYADAQAYCRGCLTCAAYQGAASAPSEPTGDLDRASAFLFCGPGR